MESTFNIQLFFQDLFGFLALETNGDVWATGAAALLLLVNAVILVSTLRTRTSDPAEQDRPLEQQAPQTEQLPERKTLGQGLQLSRERIWSRVIGLVRGNNLSEAEREQIEELLYEADMSGKLINELLEYLETERGQSVDALSGVRRFFEQKAGPIQEKLSPELKLPSTVLIVGINGAGKTTSIGKLASKFSRQGKSVIVGACDTFRAAAVEQLQTWCNRSGAEIVKAKQGSDPSGVAYEAVQKARSSNADVCLIDTAGRLHTAKNLMEELKKTKRVLQKIDPHAPQECWLVIDSITGQNAMAQAREFHNALDLTGIIFTKCDGSAKAGNALSIIDELGIPIVYIGVGENEQDLQPFRLEHYLDALLGNGELPPDSLTSQGPVSTLSQ